MREQLEALIGADMTAFQDRYREVVLRNAYPTIRDIGEDLMLGTGKQLRPTLSILVYRALKGDAVSDVRLTHLCTSLELLHVASLVHDDVIDEAELRHGKPALYRKFGVELAIPYGVYLYALSLKEIAKIGSLDVLTQISQTVERLCEGEMVQVGFRDNLDIKTTDYVTILKKKTGVLFSAACVSACYLADTDLLTRRAMSRYGTSLGIAFQLVDDYLDVLGDASGALKKVPGQDFMMGELTLPLLVLRDVLPVDDQAAWRADMLAKTPDALSRLQVKIKEAPEVADRVKALLDYYLNRAEVALEILPESPYRELLSAIVAYIRLRGELG
jgi:geranylgeranyl pyrophosphate synthase